LLTVSNFDFPTKKVNTLGKACVHRKIILAYKSSAMCLLSYVINLHSNSSFRIYKNFSSIQKAQL